MRRRNARRPPGSPGPRPARGQPLDQGRGRDGPRLVEEGADQALAHRQGHEQQQQRAAQHHRAGHEQIAAKMAQARDAGTQQHQQRQQRDGTAQADAELALRQRTEPAAEGLEDQPRAPIANPLASRPARPRPAPPVSSQPCMRPAGMRQPSAASMSPDTPVHSQGLWCTAACTRPLAVSLPPKMPAASATRTGSAGNTRAAARSRPAPAATSPARCAARAAGRDSSRPRAARWTCPRSQRGSELTSFSHLEIKRLRSALAPYFA